MSPDERLLRVARTRFHNPTAERLTAGFSRLGQHGAVWLAIGTLGWAIDPPRRARWRAAATTVSSTYALNVAIKRTVRRPRPRLEGLPPLTSTPTQLSFPSAHASTSVAGAIVYARLGLPAGPLAALATGLALSRVYLGVHYPSDILAGALLGALVGTVGGRCGGPDTAVGRGVAVGRDAAVGPGAAIGRDTAVGRGAAVGPDAAVGRDVGSGSNVAGGATR